MAGITLMVEKQKGKEPKCERPWMRWVKKFTSRKDRQATREKLHHEEYDDIPQGKRTKVEDPWAWD